MANPADTASAPEGQVNRLPGVEIEAEQPLAHSISHMLSGVAAQIAIKVYGDDLETLRAMAENVKATIGNVPGITPLSLNLYDRPPRSTSGSGPIFTTVR